MARGAIIRGAIILSIFVKRGGGWGAGVGGVGGGGNGGAAFI